MAVVGPVGSGKSTLLATLLEETTLLEGTVRRRGKVAVVEQEPCVLAASLRDNILFGLPEDPVRLGTVIQMCQLEPDMA